MATRQAQRRVRAGPSLNPFVIPTLAAPVTIPDPIEFVVSDRYLNRSNLYPRQATLLKIFFLQVEMLSEYDLDVIGEWEDAFRVSGNEGVAPGLLARMEVAIAQGRPWFREILAVIGRRGSKGFLGALSGAYVLWHYMHRPGGPQAYYGIDRSKQLSGIVFAGKKEQARDNQWKDLNHVILEAPCFAPFISKPLGESLSIFAPTDALRIEELRLSGIVPAGDMASFIIEPSASTLMAGRGPTSFMQFYDEFAHIIASGSNRDAESIWTSALPSLDQFGVDAFIYEPSSPWQMLGQFYENWKQAIEINPDGTPAYPEKFMVQLPSWGPYLDWEYAALKPIRPPKVEVIDLAGTERVVPGEYLKPLKRAIQTYDDQMRQLERANPDTFGVERRAHWAASLNAYLNPRKVEAAYEPYRGQILTIQSAGALAQSYVAHGDPATNNCRFGWALGHRVLDPDDKMYHVVFDQVRCWDPADYPDHTLDYDDVMSDIETDVANFSPEQVTFDQFNVPATIGRLRKFVAHASLPKQVQVSEKTATRALNWQRAEIFKAALNMGLVHIPMNKPGGEVNYASSEVELELRFLQEHNDAVDHPSTGPVQTKDIADTLMQVVYALLGEQMSSFLGQNLAEVGVSGSTTTYTHTQQQSVASNEIISRLANVNARNGSRGMVRPRSRGGRS